MATFYLDYEGGNDVNDGTTFANRWKTLTSGATLARLAAGDTVRIMASPDPTSLGINGTWVNASTANSFTPTSSTNATPIVFTKVGHGLSTGDMVIIYGHTTNTNANGVWAVTVSGDTFTLLNADGSNSVGNGVGGATGTVRKASNFQVSLASALTANIACYGNQGSTSSANWTASANVTCTATTADFKEGGSAQQIAVGASFTTGLAAYFATLSTLNLSGYQQLSFWIKQTAGTIGAASSISLKLCSDTAGVTAVNTFNIPNVAALNQWIPFTVDLSTNLGSSIQSIAFYVNTDNAAQTFIFDNIIACKASSSADSLSLTSLIGKNDATEEWIGIQSINGTRVMLDQVNNTIPKSTSTSQNGYSGTSETVTTYKRETIKTDIATASSTAVQTINQSGALGSLLTFSGGWNRTDMSTQTGDTIFDGQNGFGTAITLTTKSFVVLTGISLFRYAIGYYFTSTCKNNATTSKNINNCGTSYYLYTATSAGSVTISNCNNNLVGLYFYQSYLNTISISNCNSNTTGINQIPGTGNNTLTISKLNNCTTGLLLSGAIGNKFTISDSTLTGTVVQLSQFCLNYLTNSVLNGVVKFSAPSSYSGYIWSTNEDLNTDTHYGYTFGGLIASEGTIRHTASGISWKMSPTSSSIVDSYPLSMKIATVSVESGVSKTISAWFRRSNTGLTARIICYSGQLTGISTTSSSMTASADTWEQLSIAVTSTQKGVIEIFAECYGGTTYSCYIDDITTV